MNLPEDTQKNTHEHTCTLTFLGTGASCGVPSFFCGCKACEEARKNPRAARNCSGLLITGKQHTLIDTAPELRRQLIREEISAIDQVLLTHEHFDHLGGIPQLEFYVKLKTKVPIPVYANATTIKAIEQQFAFMLDTLDLHLIKAFDTLHLDGVSYTALQASHSRECFGYLIEIDHGDSAHNLNVAPKLNPTHTTRTAYFPDTGPLSQQTLEYLQDLDTLIIDSTYSGTNWMPATHHSIEEAIELAERLKPKQTFLTHLSMHYDDPITLEELEHRLSKCTRTVHVAFDGLSIAL